MNIVAAAEWNRLVSQGEIPEHRRCRFVLVSSYNQNFMVRRLSGHLGGPNDLRFRLFPQFEGRIKF